MTRNSCIKKNSDNIVTNEIDGELVMVNIDMGKYYGFDNIGTKVWELIEEETKIADIIKKLLEEYNAPEEIIEKDVLKFLTKLEEERIIKIVF